MIVELSEGAWRSQERLPQGALLVVEEGLVLLTSARPGASRRVVIAVAGADAVLLPPTGSERIEALTEARLRVVAEEELAELSPAEVLALLGHELRDRQESLAAFASVRHADRVREKLLQLARAHGRVGPGGIRLDLPLTHELLGEMVGSARETVTWALAELQREGFVRREGRTYRLSVAPELLAAA